MGRMVPQQYKYWFRTSQLVDDYEAYLPDRLSGWAPRCGPETVIRSQEAAARLGSISAAVSRSPESALCLARADGIASSRIEGVIASMRAVSLWDTVRSRPDDWPFDAESNAVADGAAKITASAHRVGSERDRPMGVDDITSLHTALFRDTVQDFNPGRFRIGPVWIGNRALRTPSRARFVPPPHAEVPGLVEDLIGWVNSRECLAAGGPVGMAAVAHAQFETIHPFEDGNGRVGRAFMHACLARHAHYPAPMPISAAMSSRKAEYLDALRAFDGYLGGPDDDARAEAASVVIEWVSTAVEVACAYAECILAAVRECERQVDPLRAGSARRAVMEQLTSSAAAAVPDLAARLGLTARTAQRTVRRLESDGLVRVTRERRFGGSLVAELPSLLAVVDERAPLLDALWRQADDGRSPDADLIPAYLTETAPDAAAAEASASQAGRCEHIGVRSGEPCILGAGHSSPHRYRR